MKSARGGIIVRSSVCACVFACACVCVRVSVRVRVRVSVSVRARVCACVSLLTSMFSYSRCQYAVTKFLCERERKGERERGRDGVCL